VNYLSGVLCCRTPGSYDFVWVNICTLAGCICLFHPLSLSLFGIRAGLDLVMLWNLRMSEYNDS
jgi:hypothetical protein